MFNVGGPELLVILLVALIVLGPQRLPEAARTVGRVVTELRRVSTGFQDELRNALDEAEKESHEADAVPLASTVAAADSGSDVEPATADGPGERPALAPAVNDALGEIVGDGRSPATGRAPVTGRDGRERDGGEGSGDRGEHRTEVPGEPATGGDGERRAAS